MCRDSQLFESPPNLVRDNEKGSSRPGVRRNDFEASRMSFILILTHLVPNPADNAVLNVVDTTQEGYYSNRGFQNASDETLSRRKTSGVNAGYTIKNASRRCYASPDLRPVLIFRVSGHDLQMGSKSHNQSRTDVGETLEDCEPPFPPKYRDRRETLEDPKEYTRPSYPQMKGVSQGCAIIHSGAKLTPNFVGDPRGNQEQESTSGRFINQTRLQLDPTGSKTGMYVRTQAPHRES